MAGEEGEQDVGSSGRRRRIRTRARRVLARDEELEDEETGGVWGGLFGNRVVRSDEEEGEGNVEQGEEEGMDKVQREMLARAAKKAVVEKAAREEQLRRSRQEQSEKSRQEPGEKRKRKETTADAPMAKRAMVRTDGSSGLVNRPSVIVVAPPIGSDGSLTETSRVAALGGSAGAAGSAGATRTGSRQSDFVGSNAFPDRESAIK